MQDTNLSSPFRASGAHKRLSLAIVAASLLAIPAAASAASATLTVAGTANPFLAAQPNGTPCCGGDTATAQSPKLASAAFSAGQVLTFSATGGVSYQGGAGAAGADGDNDGVNYTYRYSMSTDYGTGVSGAQNVNVDGLVGVFVSGVPGGTAPAALDFAATGGSTGLDFTSLAPGIDQIFWIGDGLTGIGSGAVQQFTVPTNATALYLGTVDGSGWANNSGAFSVTINGLTASSAPEPAAWALMMTGLIGVGGALRRRRPLLA